MEGEIKNFEDLLSLMPLVWEEKARELGALTPVAGDQGRERPAAGDFSLSDQHTVIRENSGGAPVRGMEFLEGT
jgi:hypothetical protein